MGKFKKKPVEVEALRWDGTLDSFEVIYKWANPAMSVLDAPVTCDIDSEDISELQIYTLEGTMTASPGDWIIKEPFPTNDRYFYPCKPDIFSQTYEPA